MQEKKNYRKYLVYGLYSKLLDSGRYHGRHQTSCCIIASSWLLATFVAVGFLLSKDNILPFEHILAVPIVCLLGAFSICLVWYEDTVVEEILLDVHVIHAMELEKKEPWIPQVHHRFLNLYHKNFTNARFVKVLFFVGCKAVLFITMAASFFIYFFEINIFLSVLSAIGSLAINYFSSRYMLSKAGKIQDLMRLMNERR